MKTRTIDRRRFLLATGLVIGVPTLTRGKAAEKPNPDEGVTAPEDLMKEHGVLNRCLLIYEGGMRRLRNSDELTPEVFGHTAQLIHTFVEQYHEQNEEKYIFPEFAKAQKLVALVDTLKIQHRAGRQVTAQILDLSQPDKFRLPASREKLLLACASFIRMYRRTKLGKIRFCSRRCARFSAPNKFRTWATGWKKRRRKSWATKVLKRAWTRWLPSRNNSASTS